MNAGRLPKLPYEARVFREPGDGFTDLRNTSVLLYWPHGFGDWVFLSYMLPLLEPSNRYFVSRHGDHNISAFEGCALAAPLYCGENNTRKGDRDADGVPHFGLRTAGGGRRTLELPPALHDGCVRHGIEAFVDLGFWEARGNSPFPYHTKARMALKTYVAPARLRAIEQGVLTQPLRSCLHFAAPPAVEQLIETRLRSLLDIGRRKLCIIIRNGYTQTEKNWGHLWREDMPEGRRREGEECRDFIRLLHRKDPSWVVLVVEDQMFTGDDTVRDPALNCFSYAEIFGPAAGAALPFGWVAKALVRLASLVVGVPAGLFHLAVAYPAVPVVGVWTAFLPSWWDEPRSGYRNVAGRFSREQGWHELPGSFAECGGLHFAIEHLNSRIIPGEAVFAAVEKLLF